MSQLPPPPPGFSEVPPPPGGDIPAPGADLVNIPPPAPEGEQHENDVLKRRKHFSWKRFGGEGFLVSVSLHLILLILGLFWIVNKWREPAKKPEETFASGSGGGANGDRAKQFEHRMQQRQPMIVKTPSRIVSRSSTASVSLPNTPTTSTASFASGLSAGGMSKGSGGGTGGGEGTGIGIGKGGGRNFVSAFGGKNATNTLNGCIYDFFQTRDGKPSKNPQPGAAAHQLDWMRPIVSKFIDGNWDESQFDRYFKGPATLGVTQILIPISKDNTAPKAFEVEDKMKGGAWIVVYRGRVTAPENMILRFIGSADNFIAVRLDGKNVMAFDCGRKPSEGITLQGMRTPFVRGPWTEVKKGQTFDMAVLLGDAGGVFSASLTYEKKDQPGRLFLFRTEENDFAPILEQDLNGARGFGYPWRDLPPNIDPNSPVWPCKSAKRLVR